MPRHRFCLPAIRSAGLVARPSARERPPWQSLLAIGVKKALKHTDPDAEVVGIVGDYGFQFLVEELAVAAQYNVPFVLIMLNNEYLGLIRQASIVYDMNYEVDVHYGEFGTDNLKLMEAYGCSGRRVLAPPTSARRSSGPARKPSRPPARCSSRS
ncbi:thiamine pyrophosphate-dependent enzyme [Actinacidiphila oryziradicis]|uniref:thiamine pyrophosphate-dependent enzyme n=1 Tax=Actinacidiphila oryziradicis TaxID=2571141 RepID=UPI002AFF4524|nr:thiamine pyrophosphate-dependent enzyme [Actinacidiphila oryziradicis]